MSRPWLSVIMPTYNGEPYLRPALESVVAQGDPDIEIIAIDDGSTDATTSILRSFSSRMSLRVFSRPAGNWADNTNHALAQARAEYACFLHQDDLWLPDRPRILKRLLAQAPGVVMVLHPSWFIDAAGERLGVWRCPLPSGVLPSDLVVQRLLVQNFIAAPAPLFRRDLALDVGGLDPALWYAADWDFWLKLATAGPTIYYQRPLTSFRIHLCSQTLARGSVVDDVHRQMRFVLAKHLEARASCALDNAAVRRAAVFSVELNTCLFSCYQGFQPDWLDLARRFLRLGPASWVRFVRDSRILERALARIRAGVLAHRRKPLSRKTGADAIK